MTFFEICSVILMSKIDNQFAIMKNYYTAFLNFLNAKIALILL